MKYKIISHDDHWHVTTVKAAEDEAGLETGMIIPVSLVNISGVADFESRVYQVYMGSRPSSTDLINNDLMAHVTSNISNTLPLSDTMVSNRTTLNDAPPNFINLWSIHPESTVTNTQQSFPDEVI